SSHASSVSRNGPSFGRGWLERRYSNRSPSERSARLTVLRESARSRAIALIDSPCTSRRRRFLPIVSTHSTPVHPVRPVKPYRVWGGQFWKPISPQTWSELHAGSQTWSYKTLIPSTWSACV